VRSKRNIADASSGGGRIAHHDLGANGTEVVLRHEGLTKKQAESHTGGWTSILEKLGSALA